MLSCRTWVNRTDVWALGCCLYSMAFLQNCFEEGSNLAILSRNFKIPEDNPYGDGLVELLDRMLTVDYKSRADMTEVILCLSAVYSGRPLPPRKKPLKPKAADEEKAKEAANAEAKKSGGFFRTDGQGIRQKKVDVKKPVEVRSHSLSLTGQTRANSNNILHFIYDRPRN